MSLRPTRRPSIPAGPPPTSCSGPTRTSCSGSSTARSRSTGDLTAFRVAVVHSDWVWGLALVEEGHGEHGGHEHDQGADHGRVTAEEALAVVEGQGELLA